MSRKLNFELCPVEFSIELNVADLTCMSKQDIRVMMVHAIQPAMIVACRCHPIGYRYPVKCVIDQILRPHVCVA
jgi:hypothetical protein